MNQGRFEGNRRGSWEDRDSRRDEAFEDEWARPRGQSHARDSSYGGTRPDQGHGWPDEGGYLGRDERHPRGRNQDMDEGLSARDSGGRYDGGTQGSRGERGDWREGQGWRNAGSGEWGYGEGRYGEDYGERRHTGHGNQGYSAGGRGWGGDVGEGVRGRGEHGMQGMQRGGRGMEGQRYGRDESQGQGYGQGYGGAQRQGRGMDSPQGGQRWQSQGSQQGQWQGGQQGRRGRQGEQQWGTGRQGDDDQGMRQRMGEDMEYRGGGADEERRHRGGGPFPDQTRRPWRSVAEPDDPRTRELYAGAYGISDSETPSMQGWASEARWHDEGWRDQGGGFPLSERPGAGGRPGGWPADEGRRMGQHTHGQEYAYEGFTGAGTGAGMGGVQAGQTQRRVMPKGYQRSDDRIREDVCERLAHESGLDVGHVEVNVKDGVVTLTGSVNDRRQKYRIEDVADDCFGVKDVDNQVRVQRQGESGGASQGAAGGDQRISGISSAGEATGSTASSYGGGLELGSGERQPKGGEPYGGTTNPTKSVT